MLNYVSSLKQNKKEAASLWLMKQSFFKLQTLNKLLESEGEEFVAGVVEVEAVGGVFLRDLGAWGSSPSLW